MALRSGRLEYVETIRGIVCILLVTFHVTGSASNEGLGLDLWHPLRIINDGLDNSRMPIFAFISGFVLSAAIVTVTQWRAAMFSKVKRLLIPMVVVSTIFYALRAATGYDQQPFFSIFFVQYAHYWFLQAIFVLILLLVTLSLLLKGRSDIAAMILFVVFVPIYIFVDRWSPNIMSMYQGAYLAPFFYAGHLFAYYLRHRAQADEGYLPAWLTVASGVLLACLLVFNVTLTLELVELPRQVVNFHKVILGLCSALFLFLLRPRSKILLFFGTYTYAIFLFHVIFTAGTREVMWKIWPGLAPEVIFVPACILGLFGPIIVEKLALKNDLSALLLLGVDLKAQRKKAARRQQEAAATQPAWTPAASSGTS